MTNLLLKILFICGIIYGIISLFITVRKKANQEMNQLVISISLVVACTAAFLMTLN
ncbi:hypothetical protein WAK64_13005 [Bacillus spongiae]|uniref:Uncharacterized protein n=1 Tax=Bacillus spongiae TaxID=2683610 RepID=A0ABU8HF18_9BACI